MRRGLAAALAVAALVVGWLVLRDDPAPRPEGAAAAQPCRPGTGLDYSSPEQGRLAWSDEFDGDAVDTGRWSVRDETTLSFDQARIMARNVLVQDGVLRIEARRDGSGERPVTTGYLDTIDRFSQQHGRFEVRARLPVAPQRSRGLWPAFWLRADDRSGEIDVMEAWGTPTVRDRAEMERQYAWTVHEDTMSGPGSTRTGGWGRAEGDPPLADDFHLYAVDWSPTCLRFSIDGRTTGLVDLRSEPAIAAAIDDTVNIRLNLQVGGSYWGRLDPERPESTELPAALEVDHVRVYAPLDQR